MFTVQGSLLRAIIRQRLMRSGAMAASIITVNATFEADRSNPWWSLWGYRVDTQPGAIINALSKAIGRAKGLPESTYLLDDATIAKEFGDPVANAPKQQSDAVFWLMLVLTARWRRPWTDVATATDACELGRAGDYGR